MQVTLAHIGGRVGSSKGTGRGTASSRGCFEALTRMYVERIGTYHECQAEAFAGEGAFLAWVGRQHGRVPAMVILLDSTGRQFSSAGFAEWLGARRDQGAQHLVFAVGPHDGWSVEALATVKGGAGLVLSYGAMTLPHEMARLVLAEQVYRACTILAGHPYHGGH